MDHPDLIQKLITVDGLPVLEHLERADWKFARDWYDWFFFAQPEKPERAISAKPAAWYSKMPPNLMGAQACELAASHPRSAGDPRYGRRLPCGDSH